MIKVAFVIAWLTLLLSSVAAIFWYSDWKYQLPTPVPKNYTAVTMGTKIDLKSKLPNMDDKAVFLHFYNPECPCSRFNKSHFQSLVREYGKDTHFVIVVLSDKIYSQEDIQEKIGLKIPVIFDQSLATQCGVYSTPQAAIIDNNRQLYYRGNYNSSRYCTAEKTAYAKIALDGLLKSQALPVMTAQALKSYGCMMPVCKN
ncbi:redoxin domain-containing protein [Dyadobacter sp. CY107]|uniref:DUF6436 domain-containing protein n=1 Tax=Dyadobacter fanqingshengii TaxID=2906443 RepID=UPI001F306CC8|nr:redoxin domain-containing protein [Dyadobacter fanqingshengii]MCF2505171.1 redoxin domain-containing protein [Dyadobacter fanqingshengii]